MTIEGVVSRLPFCRSGGAKVFVGSGLPGFARASLMRVRHRRFHTFGLMPWLKLGIHAGARTHLVSMTFEVEPPIMSWLNSAVATKAQSARERVNST